MNLYIIDKCIQSSFLKGKQANPSSAQGSPEEQLTGAG
jgi:hypothetical protein